eukprot:840221-Pyramimonas_sp.AAC.1
MVKSSQTSRVPELRASAPGDGEPLRERASLSPAGSPPDFRTILMNSVHTRDPFSTRNIICTTPRVPTT